jgi:hypothetical protein
MPLTNLSAWFGVIAAKGCPDILSSRRRSPRLHWSADDARREVERWVAQLNLGPISWDYVDADWIIARLSSGNMAIVGKIDLPQGVPPEPCAGCEEGRVKLPVASLNYLTIDR